MRYHSYASNSSGTTDPEEVYSIRVEGEDCTLRGCIDDSCEHRVFMWSGNEYSKNHTWIATDDSGLIDLEKVR